jgi:hypothetical protein
LVALVCVTLNKHQEWYKLNIVCFATVSKVPHKTILLEFSEALEDAIKHYVEILGLAWLVRTRKDVRLIHAVDVILIH